MPTRRAASQLARALEGWTGAIGTRRVITDRALLAKAETATFATRNRLVAILRPRTRAHVQACLRVASRCSVPLYPISAGKNWGYGSRVPTADGCALLDLSGMRRILDFDEDLAYVTVEPGVTFRQIFTLLQNRRSRLTVSVTGGSPDASIVGNALERGLGVGPYSDQVGHVCAIESVLPNGKLVRTGFGRFPGAKLAALHRWGCGPSFDGLFSQSNLGVVTAITVWLYRAPEYFGAIVFTIEDPRKLTRLVDTLRVLRLEGTITAPYRVWNDLKVIGAEQAYPWAEARGRTPLPERLRRRMRATSRCGAWAGLVQLFASTSKELHASRAAISRSLEAVCDSVTFTWSRRTSNDGEIRTPPMFVPVPWYLLSSYWRKRDRESATLDLDADRCGVIWFGPLVPNRGTDAVDCVRVIERTLTRWRFEPNIALRGVGERALHVIGAIIYDRGLPGEDQRAMDCHDRVLSELRRHGYLPYRLGIQSMGVLPRATDDSAWLSTAVKSVVDPAGILAPDRYEG